jgi:chitodextrinase
VLTSATAKNSGEVDLAWSASTDNVGVTGYQIIRNGSAVASVSASTLAYADTAVTANATYTYAVKAFDAAGNYSGASNSIAATTPPAPAVLTCPGPVVGAFTGCYYNGTDLSGNPALVRTDSQINFAWGGGSPAAAVTPLNFSVRWQGIFNFAAGTYTFSAKVSDGMRLYIDGTPIKFAWRDGGVSLYMFPQTMTQGNHLITFEYYEHTGTATAVLSWQSNAPVSGSGPAITSFTATPSALAAGQSATLSWNVSGASAVSIDNGIGSVSPAASTTVSPQQTTTYTLTATNTAGTATAHVVISVNAVSDTQPPVTPTLVSATAKNASEVDLAWKASTDNVGVAGYQILRNGSPIGSVSGASLAYADTTVAATTTYTYSIKAYDAAGNYSAASNSIQATTPAASTASGCPGPAMGAFTGCYYNNTDLTGNPVLVRTDNQINFAWGSASPGGGVTAGTFSVRWQGIFNFTQGNYTFSTTMSDGFRLYIDGVPVRFAWRDEVPSLYLTQQTLSQGNHLITLEYYEDTGNATAKLSWQKN